MDSLMTAGEAYWVGFIATVLGLFGIILTYSVGYAAWFAFSWLLISGVGIVIYGCLIDTD